MSAGRVAGWIMIIGLACKVAPAEVAYQARQDIIHYGATAIGSPYVWGGSNWDPDDRG